MIADLKPYAEYKESGLPWLGRVPGHWEALPVKQAFDIQLGKMLQNAPQTTADSSAPYLKSQHVQWSGVRTSDLPRMWASPRDLSQFGVRPGDLLVCEGGEGGRCAVLKTIPPGVIVQNALHRVRPRGENDNRFLAQAMAVVSSVGWFQAINNKATIAHFTRDKFGGLGIPLPPPADQAAIVRFLDWANGRLERAIRAKRKVIALLNEQKQAIIHRAVTRGLDPSVPLKPSSIPWLGDIPQHWEVRKLKHLARFQSGDGITSLKIEATGPFPVYGGNGLRGYTTRHTHDGHYALIGRQGALCGNINFAQGQFFASEHAVVSTLHSGMSVVWFGELLRVMNLNQYSQSAAQPGLAVERIKNLYAPVPPMGEQHAIVASFERNTAPLVTAISRLEREIELLREYRTRLVADVVTGKLDVREAAARLPEEAATDTAEDDTDLSDEIEPADVEAAV